MNVSVIQFYDMHIIGMNSNSLNNISFKISLIIASEWKQVIMDYATFIRWIGGADYSNLKILWSSFDMAYIMEGPS